jgi:hypothetical protein
MGRTAKNNTGVEEVVENEVVNAIENMSEEEKENTKKTVKVEPLRDTDEIDVEALVPNVSYKDSKTGDMYEWDETGHIEPMTFDTLKNMWRSHKGYFRNMWLKPNDARVINQFGLTKVFEKHEYLMDADNYTKKNIAAICDAIADTPNGMKFAICDKVKSMVISGEVSDVYVIKELEKRLKIDLIKFL